MQIDKDVLPPVGVYKKIAEEIINTLQVGESTLLDKKDGEKIRTAMNSCIYRDKIKLKRFVTRFDRNFGALRVWRVL